MTETCGKIYIIKLNSKMLLIRVEGSGLRLFEVVSWNLPGETEEIDSMVIA
jgi:hypothetical protein